MTRWHNSVPWFGLLILAIGSVLLIVGGVSGVWIAGVAGGVMIGAVFGYWLGQGDAVARGLLSPKPSGRPTDPDKETSV